MSIRIEWIDAAHPFLQVEPAWHGNDENLREHGDGHGVSPGNAAVAIWHDEAVVIEGRPEQLHALALTLLTAASVAAGSAGGAAEGSA